MCCIQCKLEVQEMGQQRERTKAEEVSQGAAAEPGHCSIDDAGQACIAATGVQAAGGGLFFEQFLLA